MLTSTLVLLSTLWVLPKIDAVPVPPPPPARSANSVPRPIDYWDAGSPGYRWNEIAFEMARGVDVVDERLIAALNIAIDDATRAAFHYKKKYGRSSYPSEHGATAGAAEAVMVHLLPSKREEVLRRVDEARRARIEAGSSAAEVEAGLALGRAVGALVVERLKNDGSGKKWTGSVPTTPGLWNGSNPYDPEMAKWKTWILPTAAAFRPPAPPKFGEAEMKDVRDHNGGNRVAAYKWAITGLLRYWNEQAALKIFEEKLDRDPLRAAEIYATLSAAYYDALIACWDAKYTYWGIRPFQLDPEFKPLITTPNFPGYVSGHATFGAVAATVLSHYFPRDAKKFNAIAEEIAMSRLWGGIHFRIDNDLGLELGRKVGEAAIARVKKGNA